MRCMVTGAAGFIGATLAGRLLEAGHQVAGIDCFSDYYPRWIKERNLARIAHKAGFDFFEEDLAEADLNRRLETVDVCFHLAAQAGVRRSWGKDFGVYTRNNILATQKVLEASVSAGLKRLVFASSSSVYGDAPLPFSESTACLPVSPYGITKLTCEHLARLYHKNFGLSVVCLRYFTVYGPGQRPDMAFHRFIQAIREGVPVELYGDGSQTRDFTFVDDVVQATIAAGEPDRPVGGKTINIAGGSVIRLSKALDLLGAHLDRKPVLVNLPVQRGDAKHTGANIAQAREHLDYRPAWSLDEGLKAQIAWHVDLFE